MEAQWQADRALLRRIMQPQPQWTQQDYAESIGRSIAWVKKWMQRLRAALPDDLAVLRSQSPVRKHLPPKLHQVVIDRLLEIRSAPPAPLHRIPGPKTIRYYLEQDPELRAQGLRTRVRPAPSGASRRMVPVVGFPKALALGTTVFIVVFLVHRVLFIVHRWYSLARCCLRSRPKTVPASPGVGRERQPPRSQFPRRLSRR
jgi:hypothetical protein